MNEEEKLWRIFEDRLIRMWRNSRNNDVYMETWRDYILGLGMKFVDHRDDAIICIRDPIFSCKYGKPMNYISMDEETALKILFMGELP